METTIETHNQSKCRLAESSPSGYTYKTTPASKAQGTEKEPENWEVTLEGTPIKSHQHNCLNIS